MAGGEGSAGDPLPEGRATQGTHTEHTQPAVRCVVALHVEHAERRNKYQILFMFSLFYEYSNLEYAHICVIYRVTQAEYEIRILMAAPQEYVNTYSTRRVVAFTRYCHCQYCVVYIAITRCRGQTLYCAIVWAMTGWGGVPTQRVGAQRIVLIRAQRPINKTLSCIGQVGWWPRLRAPLLVRGRAVAQQEAKRSHGLTRRGSTQNTQRQWFRCVVALLRVE